MLMMINTQTFLAEAACAASPAYAHAPVGIGRRTVDAPALAGRFAT